MSSYTLHKTSPAAHQPPDAPPPAWVLEMLGPIKVRHERETGDGIRIELLRGVDHALTTVSIPQVRPKCPVDLRMLTVEAYTEIGRTLGTLIETGPPHPVRFWNHIPGVLDDVGGGQNRYMAFNAGRFAAFTTWYGDVDAFDHHVATATGVGHRGDDLIIHCLSARQAGKAVANPRQISPHRYSRRYGPMPPCFARATWLDRSGVLMVGGTASVVGEDSMHLDDLAGQFDETMSNLAAIADVAFGPAPSRALSLERYGALRVYHPDPAHRPRLTAMVADTFPMLAEIEWTCTDLCRSELLVEIEGLASDQA